MPCAGIRSRLTAGVATSGAPGRASPDVTGGSTSAGCEAARSACQRSTMASTSTVGASSCGIPGSGGRSRSRRTRRVEVLEHVAHRGLGAQVGQRLGVGGGLLAQLQRGWQGAGHVELLALGVPAQPPHRVVGVAEVLQRLAGAGQVVELAALLGLADRLLDGALPPGSFVAAPPPVSPDCSPRTGTRVARCAPNRPLGQSRDRRSVERRRSDRPDAARLRPTCAMSE